MVGGEQRSKTSPWPHLSRVAKKRKRAKQYERLEKRESWHRLGLLGQRVKQKRILKFKIKKIFSLSITAIPLLLLHRRL